MPDPDAAPAELAPDARDFGHMANVPSGNVQRVLDLSVGHLPRVDRDWLERVRKTGDAWPPALCLAGANGWLFSVVPDLALDLSDHLVALPAILARAWALGCDYVILDSDGPVDEVLPFFEED
ncbi:hypothetical protein HLH33_13705 [Gluconacetobacter diazotrophicus]|uniref:DUF5983 domain-containing protein n=1 Tax=Gluconacetobacter diazotrophicus TaxID=33996 RepID=A0A7W4I6X5_GLUDI|nr:hypothetical protein [Gluconacetobacter diazotrophicus]MBB2157354.1 hypothetical protein [Gluconacetobacter diazotrophicus]